MAACDPPPDHTPRNLSAEPSGGTSRRNDPVEPRGRVLAPDLERDVDCAAAVSAPVLISAGAGVAEWLARIIHDRSSRSGEPFVVCRPGRGNQHSLLNSVSNDVGSGRGTLVVAEVADAGREVQALLRDVLSGLRPNLHLLRIIATTSVSLFDRVERGEFDAWLFYRLNEIHIQVGSQEAAERAEVLEGANWSPFSPEATTMNVAAFRQHRLMLRIGTAPPVSGTGTGTPTRHR